MAVNVTGGTGGETWGKGGRKGGGKGNPDKPEKEGEELLVSRDDVYGGGLLDGDKVTYDETTNERNGKPKAINVSGGTGGSSWGKGDEPKGDSWGKGGGYGK